MACFCFCNQALKNYRYVKFGFIFIGQYIRYWLSNVKNYWYVKKKEKKRNDQ